VQTCRESSPVEQTPSNKKTGCEPQATFWERMELRLSQPPPETSPFDGDPAKYLRFRANFRDQVECKKSLSDSERLNYLMSYNTGRAIRSRKKQIQDQTKVKTCIFCAIIFMLAYLVTATYIYTISQAASSQFYRQSRLHSTMADGFSTGNLCRYHFSWK